jgi:hypothetical protein
MGMTNKIKSILAVAVLVAVFLLGAVLGWHIKPGADKPEATDPVKVTINPTAKEVKKADVAIKVVSKGQLSGTAKLPTVDTAVKDKPPDPDRPESAGAILPTEVTVPVSGTITAKYTDAKTGAAIGEDTRPISGETVVKVTDDAIKVDTKFADQVTFAVDLPEVEPVRWHVGLYYDDGWTGYLQRDWLLFKTRKADWLVWARGESEMAGDRERRVMVGVERRW